MSNEAHPLDGPYTCPRCGEQPHVYNGTQVLDGDALHLVEWHGMVEALFVTCERCESTHQVTGALRPDLGSEEFGWVLARRAPEPPVWPLLTEAP